MTDIFLWKLRKVLTIQEAAWLLTDHPLPYEESDAYLNLPIEALPSGYITYKDQLITAISEGELIPSDYYPFDLPDGREIADEKLTEISLNALEKWYTEKSPSVPKPPILRDVRIEISPPLSKDTSILKEAARPESSSNNLIFRKEKSRMWTFKAGGQTDSLPHYKGFEYIKILFDSPEIEFHVGHLSMIVDKTYEEGVKSLPPSQNPRLDYLSITQLKEARHALEIKINEAKLSADTPEAIGELNSQLKQIDDQIKKDTKPTGGSKSLDKEIERTRQRVTKAIKESIDKLKKLKNPELTKHLDFITPRTYCCYRPDSKVSWNTS